MERLEISEEKGLGNTSQPKKRFDQKVKWTFTIWHYVKLGSLERLERFFNSWKDQIEYLFYQEEVASNPREGSDGLHIQGYIKLNKRSRPTEWLFYDDGIHFEGAKGSEYQNWIYCTKDSDEKGHRKPGGVQFVNKVPPAPKKRSTKKSKKDEEEENPYAGLTTIKEPPPGGWQEELTAILSGEPNDRTVYWLWEPIGCVGKTTYCRWACARKWAGKAILVSGKADDMKYAIAESARKPRIVFNNVPRAHSTVDWKGIEEIKDGIFFSGKYKSGQVIFDPPHIVIFANNPPESVKLSADRLKLGRIVDGQIQWEHSDFEFPQSPMLKPLMT